MTIKQEERMVQALEGISLGLNLIAKIESERLAREYPPELKINEAEIFRVGEVQDEAGDEAHPIPGRFEKRFASAKE